MLRLFIHCFDKMRSKIKKTFFTITGIFISVSLTLIVLEISTRLFYEFRFPVRNDFSLVKTYRISKNKNLIYELVPGSVIKYDGVTYKINKYGFRDFNYSTKKPNNVKRIAIVGDSITYGWKVKIKNTFHKQLEEMLNTRTKTLWEVLGFGIVGYTTQQEYYLIKDKVLKFSPDIIILQMCPNDYERSVSIKKYMKKNKIILTRYKDFPIPYVFGHNNISYFMMKKSYFFRFLNLRTYWFVKKYLNNKFSPKEYFFIGEQNGLEYLSKIIRMLKERKIKLFVVIFPYRLKSGNKKYKYSHFHDITKKVLQQKNVKYLDLYKPFNVPPRDDIWVDQVCHPNKRGFKIATELTFEQLYKNGYLIN